jgi:hypothetical protein
VLQRFDSRHWQNGTLPRTPYICIASIAWCANDKVLLEHAAQLATIPSPAQFYVLAKMRHEN